MIPFRLPIVGESVTCDDCGKCCTGLYAPPFLESERDLIPPRLLAEVDAAHAAEHPHGPCIWLDLDMRTCKHYEDRPFVCREFEVGGEDCLAVRNGVA